MGSAHVARRTNTPPTATPVRDCDVPAADPPPDLLAHPELWLSGRRLPTEAEWEAVAADVPVGRWHVLDLEHLHPRPPDGGGLTQLHGGAWEWTASPYTSDSGVTPEPGAVGECDGESLVRQQVLRNVSPGAARWAFSGVRLPRDERL